MSLVSEKLGRLPTESAKLGRSGLDDLLSSTDGGKRDYDSTTKKKNCFTLICSIIFKFEKKCIQVIFIWFHLLLDEIHMSELELEDRK